HVLMCELKHKDVSAQTIACLEQVLAQDPRPHYQSDPDRVYAMEFAGLEVKFTVTGDVLTVLSITELKDK
ncbi:MAG: hypothetical protein HUK02_04305, partial [Bacteroidaceae bacterium]|nr:hypothetical protein [Bacteroidaceae bacterium]